LKLLVKIVVGKAKWVALVGTLLAIVGAYYSVLLYKNLRTDIEELLPTTARSVHDLNTVTSRLEAIDNIVVLVFSNHIAGSKSFVTDLAKKLENVPKNTISSVEYRIDREVQFFKDRRTLFIELEDLKTIRNFLREKIAYETELYNPINIFRGVEIPEPILDMMGLQKKYMNKVADFDQLPGGFYATADEKVRAVIVYMPGKGIDRATRMKNAIEQAIASMDLKSYASDLEVKYTGNVQNLLEESAALVEDLELSTVIVILLVSVAMLLFYRSLGATIALVVSLFMGTFWTFGVCYFAVGYLNANTAFLASIVIGNGINFGIIFLARYLEERRAGSDNSKAMEVAIQATAPSTSTAALAAGLSYGSLMLTGFRGFSQFGVIGLIGMVLCWISAYTLMPAYLTLFDGVMKSGWTGQKAERSYIPEGVAWFVAKFPKFVWMVSLVAVGLSFIAFKNYQFGVIETDLNKLRDKRSMEKGSGALYHYIDDIFHHSFSPMVVLPQDREQSRKIAQLFKEEKERQGKHSLITTVQTLDDFIPKHQIEKIKVVKEIQRILSPRIERHLSEKERKLVDELQNPKSLVPFTEKDLPPMILGKFREHDGSIGKIVLVDKLIEKLDDSTAMGKFVTLGRKVADSVVPGTPVAGDLPISYDMFQSIIKDGPKATFFAFLAVVFLVVLLFRDFRTVGLVLISLGFGVIWLAGIILGFRLKINFLNFIALPITFGIGVDYGVNIFQRYHQEGPGSILKVIRDTGGAVMLSSCTTIIGYSSLLIAGNQAFVSFGLLAVFGEVTCLAAAVLSLPAFLCYRERKRRIFLDLTST